MQLTRRRLFIGFALGWVLSRVLPARAASPWPSQLAESTLRIYVDVLIPADETPSGTALDVDRQLLLVAMGQRDYLRLLEQGLDWLNRRAREKASGRHNTLARVFFERTRADAFFHYYGRPESWPGIARYSGPPQPSGFMDYMLPPDKSR